MNSKIWSVKGPIRRSELPLGKYIHGRILKVLHLNFSTKINANCAIKCIDKRNAPEDFVKKFLPRELEILPRLNHSNIVKVSLISIFQFYELVWGSLTDYLGLRNISSIRWTSVHHYGLCFKRRSASLHSKGMISTRTATDRQSLVWTLSGVRAGDHPWHRLLKVKFSSTGLISLERTQH